MSRCRTMRSMNSFMPKTKIKRLVYISFFFKPFYCFICKYVRHISFFTIILSIFIYHWIKIFSLTNKTKPIVKPWANVFFTAIMSHVNFTNHCCFVALLLKNRSIRWIFFPVGIKLTLILSRTMNMGICSG